MTNLKEISNNITAIELEINNDESVLSELQKAVKAKRDKMLDLLESKNRIEILIDSLKSMAFNNEELKIALSELNIINGLIDFSENIPDPGSAPINDKIQYLAVDSIGVDPKRFQFKVVGALNKTGSVGSLSGCQVWDENLAGLISIWQDPTGKKWVINGHNRLTLAKNLGIEKIWVRFIDADTDIEARSLGALINLAEGQGTPIDVAKFLRDTGMSDKQLSDKGINLNSSLVKKGIAVSKLAGPLFDKVLFSELPVTLGIAIGESDLPENEQIILWEMTKGKKVTVDTVKQLADLVRYSPSKENEFDLLGAMGYDPIAVENLAVIKATLQSEIKSYLTFNKKLFANVANESDTLESSNVATVDLNNADSHCQSLRKALLDFDAMKNGNSALSQAINDAAVDIDSGSKKGVVVKRLKEKLPELLSPKKPEITLDCLNPTVESVEVEPVAVEPVEVEPVAITKPLLDCLTNNEKSLDTLVAESGLQTEVVTSDLLMLELDSKVKQCPGLRFKLSTNFDRKNNPTEVNPTEVSPTEVSPTEVSPTEVSPTEVNPTEVNPTEVSPTVDNIFDYSRDDISRQLATWAYSGSSYQPEKLADRVIDGYCDLMAEINNEFLEYQNPPSLAMKNDLEAFKQGYIQKLNAKLTADSKTISSFVTGAGNFPTRSNEKKLQSARKKLDDLLSYEEKRLGALRRLYNPKVTLPISADDDDALTQINQKIEREEATYSEIKKLSALVRKMDPENTDDSQWKMVCDLAKEIVAKDDSLALSRLLRATSIGEGVAKSHLQSYYRSIRRLKERAVVLKREQEFRNNSVSNDDDDDNDDANFKTIKFPGGEIIENYEENRLQICFDKIPSKETRAQLKGYGFRWAPSQKAWQRQLNDNARLAASQLLGIKLEFSWSRACAESLIEKDNGI